LLPKWGVKMFYFTMLSFATMIMHFLWYVSEIWVCSVSRMTGQNWSTWRKKPVPVPICPQTLFGLAWDQTQASLVSGQGLTMCAVVQYWTEIAAVENWLLTTLAVAWLSVQDELHFIQAPVTIKHTLFEQQYNLKMAAFCGAILSVLSSCKQNCCVSVMWNYPLFLCIALQFHRGLSRLIAV
jgi:hypothetical protein